MSGALFSLAIRLVLGIAVCSLRIGLWLGLRFGWLMARTVAVTWRRAMRGSGASLQNLPGPLSPAQPLPAITRLQSRHTTGSTPRPTRLRRHRRR